MDAAQRSAGNAAVALLAGQSRSALLQRATAPADPAAARSAFARATANQRSQSHVLLGWLKEGLKSQDERLKNACEWIATGRSQLYAVTPTGDSDERLTHGGQAPDQMIALFPKVASAREAGDVFDPGGATYNWSDLDDQSHVKFERRVTGGWNTMGREPTGIAVTDVPAAGGFWGFLRKAPPGRRTKQELFETLKHEVQHSADRTIEKSSALTDQAQALTRRVGAAGRQLDRILTGQALDVADLDVLPPNVVAALRAVAGGDMAALDVVASYAPEVKAELAGVRTVGALAEYKTEYRAYSYQGSYDALSGAAAAAAHQKFGAGWNERQLAIFTHIYEGYPAITAAWDANPEVPGAHVSFRAAVLAYGDPDVEGANAWNSVRIDAVFEQLHAMRPGTAAPDEGHVRQLRRAIGLLTPGEATWVGNPGGAPRELTRLIDDRLTGAAREAVLTELAERAG